MINLARLFKHGDSVAQRERYAQEKADAQSAIDELHRTLSALDLEVSVVRKDRRRRQEPTSYRRRVDDV